MKLNLKQSLFSRTNWTMAIMIASNILEFATDPTNPLHLSTKALGYLNMALGGLAMYFRINPKQGVEKEGSPEA